MNFIALESIDLGYFFEYSIPSTNSLLFRPLRICIQKFARKKEISNVVIGTREIGRDWRMVVDTKEPVKDDRPMTAEAANK